jgi:hypothetical protein
MSQSPSSAGYQGLLAADAAGSQYSALAFIVRALTARHCTATIVKVVGAANPGGLAEVGTVDIQPLVNLVDGQGKATEHGTIYGCPYQRLQGGKNAVIIDPEVGDIGIAVFASRDISSVIARRAAANPGSARMFDWADAMYIGGILNGTPTQYVEFADDGITIKSPNQVMLDAPTVSIQCDQLSIFASDSISIQSPTLSLLGDLKVTGETTLTGTQVVTGTVVMEDFVTMNNGCGVEGSLRQDGKDIGKDHVHTGVQTGSGHTGAVF